VLIIFAGQSDTLTPEAILTGLGLVDLDFEISGDLGLSYSSAELFGNGISYRLIVIRA
jgi:hypothetical protein